MSKRGWMLSQQSTSHHDRTRHGLSAPGTAAHHPASQVNTLHSTVPPMKTAQVLIIGTSPLLMDRFSTTPEKEQPTRRISATKLTPQEEAAAAVYRDAAGGIAFPGTAISRLLRDAGSNHKVKGTRRSVRFVVPAAVRVIGDLLPLTNGDGKTPLNAYGIDARSVVNKSTKGRMLRHRPKFEHWSIRFTLTVNESLLLPDIIKTLLVEGGEQIGIGSFRPEKGGSFGTFALAEWSVTA